MTTSSNRTFTFEDDDKVNPFDDEELKEDPDSNKNSFHQSYSQHVPHIRQQPNEFSMLNSSPLQFRRADSIVPREEINSFIVDSEDSRHSNQLAQVMQNLPKVVTESVIVSKADRQSVNYKEEVEVLQGKLEIAELRMMEYYNNEQKARQQAAQYEKEIQILKQQGNQYTQYLNQVRGDKDLINGLHAYISDLKQQIVWQQEKLELQTKEIQSLRDQNESDKRQFLEEVKIRDERIQTFQTQYLDMAQQVQHLKQEEDKYQIKIKDLEAQIQDLQRDNAVLEHKQKCNDQFKDYEGKIGEIERQLSFYRGKIDELIGSKERNKMEILLKSIRENKDHISYSQFLTERQKKLMDMAMEQPFNLKTQQTYRSTKENQSFHSTDRMSSRYNTKQTPQKTPTPATPKQTYTTPPWKSKPSIFKKSTSPTFNADYKGDRYQGMRHGRGRQIYPDGTIYQGSWQFDKKQGFGTLRQGDLEIYSGTTQRKIIGHWHNDMKHGCGLLINTQKPLQCTAVDHNNINSSSWIQYQGEFKEDQYNGFGVLTFVTGERFHGHFKNGKANGKGTFYRLDGEIVPGRWVNDRFK